MPINQNSNLISNLDPTRQHESRGMPGFQNRVPNNKLLKIHANRDNWAYLKNVISNENSFAKSETTIEFVVSKRVRKWSRILIPSPD